MKDFSYITHSHPAYIENLYNEYVQNPDSVDPEYRKFFEGFDFAVTQSVNGQPAPAKEGGAGTAQLAKEFSVYSLIEAYRKKGHLVAKTNPVRERKNRGANLELKYFGLGDGDLGQPFAAGQFVGLGTATLQKILERLQ